MADDELVELKAGTRVSNRWTIDKKLGAGSFGAVYLCHNRRGEEAALKTEPINSPHRYLKMEARIMRKIGNERDDVKKHFCRCLELGHDVQPDEKSNKRTTFNYLVMTLVGRGVDRLVRQAGGSFSLGTAVGVSIQMLNAIEALHSIGYVHRDIKPHNATMGRAGVNEQRLLYLIDFGMARQYLKHGRQRRQRDKVKFRGSLLYAPVSAHLNHDYGRKDDIESWFYVLIDLCKGTLPWEHLTRKREIGEIKCRRMRDKPYNVRRQAILELMDGCPGEFGCILEHVDTLGFTDQPNYEMIVTVLRNFLTAHSIQEHPYDWEAEGSEDEASTTHGSTTTTTTTTDVDEDEQPAEAVAEPRMDLMRTEDTTYRFDYVYVLSRFVSVVGSGIDQLVSLFTSSFAQ
uniref:Protein kinase domain-containing protein n=1 Tax=Globodera rostochiensis TaxID=31243 RepID=A0A914I971_GLORO